jgi:hypothetical protein
MAHVARKAAPYAIDKPTQEAYQLVIKHAQERTAYFESEVEPLPKPKPIAK